MAEFYAPYNFVPVTGSVNNKPTPTATWEKGKENETPTKAPQARHDTWVTGTNSGRIVCRVTLKTPTVVGAGQSGGDDNTSATVTPYKVDDKTALPANSLRGMVSSISEQLSQSALRVLDKQSLSVRKSMTESIAAIGLIKKEKDNPLQLMPFTIGSLRSNNNRFQLPQKWQDVFKGRTWRNILPVYLDRYEPDGADRIRKASGSYLDTPNLEAFQGRPDQFFWAKLAGPDDPITDPLNVNTRGLKAKSAGNSHFLLGQRFAAGFTLPLTQAEYDALPAADKPHYTRGVLFILGIEGREADMPRTKKHEYFLPCPAPSKRLDIPAKTISTFERLAHLADPEEKNGLPYAPQGYADSKIKSGRLIRFDINTDGTQVSEISWSAIWRKLVDANQSEFFEKISPDLVPWSTNRKNLTPAELLYGIVKDRTDASDQEKDNPTRNLASRVRFSDALCEGEVQQDGPVCLKILSSPKLPAPSMYFQTKSGNQPIKKTALTKTEHIPRGRKVYLHHPQDQAQTKKAPRQHWETNNPQENANQKLTVNPISTGTEFWFHIDFDNLTEDELSLLFTSLSPSDSFLHRLGLGKPLGLGSVKVDIAGTFLIDRRKRYQDMLSLGLETKTSRYQNHIKGTLDNVMLPERYRAEQTALQALSATTWQPTDTLVDKATHQILTTVGDPSNLKAKVPVTYNLAIDQAQETEGFQWFVNNEEHMSQALQPIIADEKMPTLLKNHPKPRENNRR